jgi:hypothetical protein
MQGPEAMIELVRGRVGGELADEVISFRRERSDLEEAAARDELPRIVSVARDEAGSIIGVSSVRAGTPRPPARPMFVYRDDLAEQWSSARPRLFTSTFDALEAEFDPGRAGPLGVCRLPSDPAEIAGRPEAIWPEEGLIFAGRLGDGRQVRVRWFWDAPAEPGLPNSLKLDDSVAMDWSIDERYRVEPYRGDAQTAGQILALWAREAAVPNADEARRRVHEALNVVIDRDEGVVALSTAYIRKSPQVDLDLWYFRTFVSSAHRNTHIATQLTMHNRDLLEQRFLSGEDTRAAGVAFELENPGMRKYINTAIWQPVDFIFIGDNERGVPIRVHYFPGARVSSPRAGRQG